jgi:hypothetical protein
LIHIHQPIIFFLPEIRIPTPQTDAVRVGFEPTVHFRVRQFSKLFLSATQAPHQKGGKRTRFFQLLHHKNKKSEGFFVQVNVLFISLNLRPAAEI